MQAYIGGIINYSETDWPGKKAMVIFFSGCDFHCPFCRTPDILGFKENLSKDLREIKKAILNNHQIDAVLVTGGEPCLQKLALVEIAELCRENKLYFGIETNGSRPDVLAGLIDEKLVHFVRLDVKAPLDSDIFQKVTEASTFFKPIQDVISDFKQSLALLHKYEKSIDLELRTTIVPSLIFKKDDVMNLAFMLKGFKSAWMLQKFDSAQKLLSRKFDAVNPPSDEFLDNLRNAVRREYPGLNVQIRDNMSTLSLPPPVEETMTGKAENDVKE